VNDGLGYDGGLVCSLNVSDLERSVAWYRDRLGFEVLRETPEIGWAELRTPIRGCAVGLSESERVVVEGGGAVLTWGVRDLDAARARLEADGVRFDGDTVEIEGPVKLAGFFDPDGNALMLYEGLDPSHSVARS
jgi:catechol 2,3-dioxygenase-like lactoylglutathione lyase family enzyme